MNQYRNNWHQYEVMKNEIKKLNLPPAEYEARIKKLAESLGV